MNLFDLPNDLLISVFSKCCGFKEILSLDSAICSTKSRLLLHDVYSNPAISFICFEGFERKTTPFYSWIVTRGIYLRFLGLSGINFNDTTNNIIIQQLPLNKVSHLKLTGSNEYLQAFKNIICRCNELMWLQIVDAFSDIVDQLFCGKASEVKINTIFSQLTSIELESKFSGVRSIRYLANQCHKLTSIRFAAQINLIDTKDVVKLIENNAKHLTTFVLELKQFHSYLSVLEAFASSCIHLTTIALKTDDFCDPIDNAVFLAVISEIFSNNPNILYLSIDVGCIYLKYTKYAENHRLPHFGSLAIEFSAAHIASDLSPFLSTIAGLNSLRLIGCGKCDITSKYMKVFYANNPYLESLYVMSELFSYEMLKSFMSHCDIMTLHLENCSHISNEQLLNALDRGAPTLGLTVDNRFVDTAVVSLLDSNGTVVPEKDTEVSTLVDFYLVNHTTFDTATAIAIFSFEMIHSVNIVSCPCVNEDAVWDFIEPLNIDRELYPLEFVVEYL